jgi:hypothetical protein
MRHWDNPFRPADAVFVFDLTAFCTGQQTQQTNRESPWIARRGDLGG